ncbi:MAG: hypothetical protein GY827_07240 [Cytophagales bacterium]|nr:hypothetical protein [Cytophagales bacterium]
MTILLSAQEEKKVYAPYTIWLSLGAEYSLDSTQNLQFFHQQRYINQETDFSTVGFFKYIYRMDNAVLYENQFRKNWRFGALGSFVLDNNRMQDLYLRGMITHTSNFKWFDFNKSLSVDYFLRLSENTNPNVLHYNTARLTYLFELRRDFNHKEQIISPFFTLRLFQIGQFGNQYSPYQYSFIDQLRVSLGMEWLLWEKVRVRAFAMNDIEYYGSDDGGSLQLITPVFGLSCIYRIH